MPKKKNHFEQRFGDPIGKNAAYHHHIDLRDIDDFGDDALAYLLTGVKGVNMLDVNETAITNESIRLFSTLEYVKELRAKSCHLLDDDCAADLNKITSLEFLHLKNTAVTIDGLLQLNQLTNLKTLLFSADNAEAIKEKLLQLKTMLPHCEFVIDSKRYYFDAIELFIYAVNKQRYTFRLKIKNQSQDTPWSSWLIQPSENYIEAERQGPYTINDIEWIEIDPIEKIAQGKLAPQKETDHSPAILQLLDRLEFPSMITGGIISFYIVKKEL